MSEGMNKTLLLGNLGADPDLRFGQSGADSAVLRIRLATTESYFDKRSNERKERTDWHNVVVFGKRGEALQKILQKGSNVFIEGRLQTSSYEKDGQKHYRTDVVATNVILTGRAPAGESRGGGSGERQERPQAQRGFGARPQTPAPQQGGGGGDDDYGGYHDPGQDDDIPFISPTDLTRRWLSR